MFERLRKANAFKHGIFSSSTVLPGEDAQQYWQSVHELMEEWKPDGAAEYEAVLTVADARWRKLRAQIYRRLRFDKNRNDINHPSYDERLALPDFIVLMYGNPEKFYDEAPRFLFPEQIDHLKRKFPRQNFGNIKEWALAIIGELISEIEPPLPQVSKKELADLKVFQENAERLGLLMRAVETFTDEVFERELAIDERLDAMIDRALKRLIQIKAAKQALGLARPVAVVVDQPTKNAAAGISERVKRSPRRPGNH